jgi:hypothetical protein
MAAQLVITINDGGKINVTGPIDDPVLAYGMLEVARDCIRDFNDEQNRRIIPADAGALALVDRKLQ